jgi:diguanylate cyclase (GGDEF)-like protein/PAS domain S-box-containing protein
MPKGYEEDFYKNILFNIQDGVYFVDVKRRITYWNKGAETITGFNSDEIIGKSCCDRILIYVDETNQGLCEIGCPLAGTIKNGQDREVDAFFHHKSGYRVPTQLKTSLIRDSEGKITGAVEVFNDNSKNYENVEMIKKLKEDSLIDMLTGIANRKYIEQKISENLNELDRYKKKFGLLFIDIDHFKEINDNFGHDIGDEILKVVTKTLFKNIRSFDTVGRWGGEEFIVLIQNTEIDLLEKTANKLRFLVEASSYYHHDSNKYIGVTISIGATISRIEDKLKDIIARGDSLMYHSKKMGRNKVTTDLDIE